MNSRERVIRTLQHKEPDRVPMDMTITLGAYTKLVEYLGLDGVVDPAPTIANWLTYVPIDQRVMEALNIDMVHLGSRAPGGFPKQLQDGTWIDEWGIERKPISHQGGGFYLEMVKHPLKDATIKDLDDFPWPDPHDPAVIDGLLERVKWWHENTDSAIQVWLERGGLGEQAGYLRGLEQWWVDLIADKEFAVALMNKLCDIAIEFNKVCIELIGQYVQVVRFTGWDLGSQLGLIFSPEVVQTMFKPVIQREWRAVRDMYRKVNPEGRIFFHTCGAVYPLIPMFIECGLDILDPIQTTAVGMDPEKIKREFGDRLSFHGGMDIQRLIPFGTPDEIRKEVALRIWQMGRGGGYILAPTHAFQEDTPPENIVAMYEAGLKYGTYPLVPSPVKDCS